MEKSWSDALLEEFVCLLATFQKTEKFKRYQALKEQLSHNEKALALIENVKEMQKKLVQLEHSQKDTIPALKKYQKILAELEAIPLYQAFKESQEEVNRSLQEIKEKVEKTIDEIIK